MGLYRIRTEQRYVAPYAGAWIEIACNHVRQPVLKVAPYAGAWIEIVRCGCFFRTLDGRSLRGSVD